MTKINDQQNKEALEFYKEALQLLEECGAKYMLGGAFAIFHHTGIFRKYKRPRRFLPRI